MTSPRTITGIYIEGRASGERRPVHAQITPSEWPGDRWYTMSPEEKLCYVDSIVRTREDVPGYWKIVSMRIGGINRGRG